MTEDRTPTMYQHWTTNNDANGNPRRLYVGFSADGALVRVTDEGYYGRPEWTCDLIQLASVDTSPATYRRMLKADWVAH